MSYSMALLTRGFITQLQRIQWQVAQVPMAPTEAQSILVKALELPLPAGLTEPRGIFQSDVIIRTALVAAIADLRANPWLLDYVFASLPKDSLTLKDYGEQEVARAKEWFMRTDIKVLMGSRVPDGEPPPVCVSIHLMSSEEVENTLADVHYTPVEEVQGGSRSLSSVFSPKSYHAATGVLVFPEEVSKSLILSQGMFVLDKTGRQHRINSVLDSNTVLISPGTVADFTECSIQAQSATHVAALESSSFKESFSIGCHVVGEAVHLTYLHSVVVFCILRYRQALLEARGFERSFIASSDFRLEQELFPEVFFSRHINMVGFVRQSWPKSITPKVLEVDFPEDGIRVIGAPKQLPEQGFEQDGLLWNGGDDE